MTYRRICSVCVLALCIDDVIISGPPCRRARGKPQCLLPPVAYIVTPAVASQVLNKYIFE